MVTQTRYPGDLECPSCKSVLGVEYEDVSGSNEGTEEYYCYNCGKAVTITTDFYFSVLLSGEDEE